MLSIYVEKAATKNTGHDKYAQYSVLMPSFGLSGKGADVERKLEFTAETWLNLVPGTVKMLFLKSMLSLLWRGLSPNTCKIR